MYEYIKKVWNHLDVEVQTVESSISSKKGCNNFDLMKLDKCARYMKGDIGPH